MNQIDLINIYYNFIFNYNTISFNRAYEDYETMKALKIYLKNHHVDLGFFNQIDEGNCSLFLRAKSLENIDYVLKTNYKKEHEDYFLKEKEKYQVLFLPGFDGGISQLFVNDDFINQYQNEKCRIFHFSHFLSEDDLSIYGPFYLFLNALYQIDNWPGIFVFRKNQWNFLPIDKKEDVDRVFLKIAEDSVFNYTVFNENDDYFIQLSDLHLGTKRTNNDMLVLNESLDELYATLHTNHQLKFLITGDLMNSPNRKNMYRASSFMNRLKKNYHGDVTFILGNHDVIVHGLNIFKQQKAKVVAYLLGENIKVFEKEKIVIIKIDTTSEGNLARGRVGKRRMDEIEEELSSIGDLDQYTLIAMMHHHLLPIKKDDFLKTKWNEKVFMGKIMETSKALVDADDVIQWLDKQNVSYVFHGHKHIPYVTKYKNMYVIGGGSSCGGGAKESRSRYLSYNVLKYDHYTNQFKYCFVFYDDLTKLERHRVKVHLLGGSL